jgi:acetyl esterase/lipase
MSDRGKIRFCVLKRIMKILPIPLMLMAGSVLGSVLEPETFKSHVDLQLPPTHARVPYGSDPLQVLDIWLAKSDKPAPVVVYIHGGGWEGGSRATIQKQGLHSYLEAGISVAAIDYRLITPAIKAGIQPPLKWPLGDAARALQFIRSKASEWNINKTRIGLTGGSAGGCSSLWLAMHDDMADSTSADPVARESTRVSCVGVWDAQSSLDPKQLREWFENPTYGAHAFGFVKEKDGRFTGDMDACLAARERILPWITEYSPIEHASADDPPICLSYEGNPDSVGKPQLNSVHGAAFGLHLKDRMDELGVECHVVYPVFPKNHQAAHIQLLVVKLTGKTDNKSTAIKTATPPPLQLVDITKLPNGIKRLDLFLLMGQSNMQGAGKLGDFVHYNSEAQAVIGRRFAEKYLQLTTATESTR